MKERESAVALYTFLREFAQLRTRTIRDVDAYEQVIWASDIPRQQGCDPQPVGGLLAIQESMSSLRQPTALGVSRTDAGKSPAATSWYTVDLLKPTRANTSGSLRIRVPESLSATILESLRTGCLQFYEVEGP